MITVHAMCKADEPDARHRGRAVSASRALAIVPGTAGYVDNVKRLIAFKAEHPDTEVNCENPPVWVGTVTVGGKRRSATRNDLGTLLDALEALVSPPAEGTAR
jgi:hypothetical protein